MNFQSILKNEYWRYQFLRTILPFGIIVSIMIIFWVISDPIFIILSLLIPFLYTIIFFILFEKGAHDFSFIPKHTTYLFEKLSYERASLRFYYMKRLFRQTFYASIIIGVVIAISFHSVLQISDQDYSKFSDSENFYNTKLKESALVDDADLLTYFKTEIVTMNEFSPKTSLIPLLEQEVKQKAEQSEDWGTYQNPLDQVYQIINEKSDYELIRMLILKIDNLEPEELRVIINENLDELKPTRLSLYPSYSQFRAFLIIVTLLPVAMLYSIGFSIYQFAQHSDYNINFSQGCFSLVYNPSNTNDNMKRRFMILGIFAYEDHVKKIIKMKINNMDRLLSYIVVTPTSKINNLAENFNELLHCNNKFELLRILEQKYGEEITPFLKKDPMKDKIKDLVSIAIPAITVTVTILGFIAGR